jgi:hypothetical protein
MTSETADTGKSKDESATSWSAVAALVITGTAVANNYGYWRIFHVAILEHIGVSDLPRLAAWPLIAAFSSVVLGALIQTVIFEAGPPRANSAPGFAAQMLLRLRDLVGLLALILGGLLAFFAEPFIAASTAPFFFGVAVFAFVRAPLQMIPGLKATVSPTVLGLTVVILGIAYGKGTVAALDIAYGNRYLHATFKGQPTDSLRYLGRVGEHVFLYDPKLRSTNLYALKDVEPLALTEFTSLFYIPAVPHPETAPKR